MKGLSGGHLNILIFFYIIISLSEYLCIFISYILIGRIYWTSFGFVFLLCYSNIFCSAAFFCRDF